MKAIFFGTFFFIFSSFVQADSYGDKLSIRMLLAPDCDSLKMAGKYTNTKKTSSRSVYDAVADALVLTTDNGCPADTISWLLKALSNSKDEYYKSVLQFIRDNAKAEKYYKTEKSRLLSTLKSTEKKLNTQSQSQYEASLEQSKKHIAENKNTYANKLDLKNKIKKMSSLPATVSDEELIKEIGLPDKIYTQTGYTDIYVGTLTVTHLIFDYEGAGKVQITYDPNANRWNANEILLYPKKYQDIHLEGIAPKHIEYIADIQSIWNWDYIGIKNSYRNLSRKDLDQDMLDALAYRVWVGRKAPGYMADALAHFCVILKREKNPRYYKLMKRMSVLKSTNKKLRKYSSSVAKKSKKGHKNVEQYYPI